jgi:hypothetical protein
MPLGTDTQPPPAPLNLQTGHTQISKVEPGWGWPAGNTDVAAFEISMDGEPKVVDVEQVLPDPVTVTLLPSTDTEPPSAPANLTGSTHPNCAFIDFNWGHSTDNVDPWWELDYSIFEDGLFRGYYRGKVHETSFGRHTFHIRAVDRSGNMSAPSNSITLDSGLSC